MTEITRDGVVPLDRLSQAASVLLEDYLNDTVAPLQVADSVLEFLDREPEEASKIILQWADHQLNINLHAIPISDLLYHALKKIQIFEDLGLASAELHGDLIARTANLIRSCCPKDELADFDTNLMRLHEGSRLFRTVELLHRAGDDMEVEGAEEIDEESDLDELRKRAALKREEEKLAQAAAAEESDSSESEPEADEDETGSSSPAAAPAAAQPSRERSAGLLAARQKQNPDLATIRQQQVALGLKRFSMLVDTLEQAKERQVSEGWVPHLLSSAALGAQNYQEFRGYLARLKRLGLEDLHMEQVFRSLAESMPDWHVGESESQPETAATAAMERVVELTEHDAEKSARLQEIVHTAVEHFNRGRLGSAMTLFDLVERLLKSSELVAFEKNRIRSSARAKLKMTPFRKLVDQPDKQGELRRVLKFFPDLRVEGLVRRLLKEEKRRNRHTIMELLRIHGREARESVSEILISSTALSGREWPWFFVRNLIRILREIPTDSVTLSEFELEAVIGYADPTHAIQVVREAIAYLGTVEHAKASEALIQKFHAYREVAPKLREGADQDMVRIQSLCLSYLLRSENKHARSVALDVLLSGSRWSEGNAQLLSVLGSVNLAADRSALDRMLNTIRLRIRGQGLAGKIQSMRMKLPQQSWTAALRGFGSTREAALQALIQALAGTPTPEVAELLSEIETLRPTNRLAELAKKTRTTLEELALQEDPNSKATLSGDLEAFGLPNIVQSLHRSEASGTLTIEAKEGERSAVIQVLFGKFVDAKAGQLRGTEALYLLMEKPLASSFRFVATNERRSAKSPQEFQALLFEGMRRRDEFERLRLLVPDDQVFSATGMKPTVPVEEGDHEFVRKLWTEVTQNSATAEACEERLAGPYRIRRLIMHWLQGGQLERLKSAAAG